MIIVLVRICHQHTGYCRRVIKQEDTDNYQRLIAYCCQNYILNVGFFFLFNCFSIAECLGMGSLPGIRQLKGPVKAIASLTSIYSCSAIPSSANLPVFRFVPLCQLKVSGLLVLAGSCTSLFISFPVFFIHPCARALTQRGVELFRSVGVLEQQALSIRALPKTGLAVVDKVRYSCKLSLL